MKLNKKLILVLLITSIIVSACSSMSTTIVGKENKDELKGGLPYYMPNKDFLITITVKDGVKTFAASTTPAYPDLSQIFVLKYEDSLISDNLLSIGTTTKGLLTSINAKTVSQLNEIFKNIAKSIGAIATARSDDSKSECSQDGTYVFRYTKSGDNVLCDEIKVNISRLGEFELTNDQMNHGKDKNTKHFGVFFKLEIPYKVRITQELSTAKEIVQEDLVFSPTESPVYFIPVSKSLFADKEATFAFTDGMLTSYKQDNKSELVALASLPADLISGYFDSIGNVFGKISNATNQEKTVIESSLSLELAKMKNELCIAAINANNSDAIKQLECTQ